MEKRRIEKMLIDAGDKFVPDILDKVLENSPQRIESDSVIFQASNNKNKKRMVFATVMATVVLFFGTIMGGLLYFNADDSVVYLDINPSIELMLNKAGNVKSVVAKNIEAETMLSGQTLTGLNLENAIERILGLAVDQNYIDSANDDNEIMLSIYNNNFGKADIQMEKLNKRANDFFISKGVKCKVEKITGNKKDNDFVADKDISPGKLKLIQSIMDLDSSLTIESLKSYSMKDLQKLFKSLNK